MDSDLSGFSKLSHSERLEKIAEQAQLTQQEADLLKKHGRLDLETAERMIENVIGTHELAFGIATNFRINDRDYLVPMVLEEPSVVAAASYSAKLARESGGFEASNDDPIMIGQIQIVDLDDVDEAREKIAKDSQRLLELANSVDPVLVKFGGGARKIESRRIETDSGPIIVVHLHVDVRDAMGANAVNTMSEKLAPELETLTGGRVRLRIISNFATQRLARSRAVWKKETIGDDAVKGIIQAYEFAEADQYRCTTHNKGIMNGIDAVVIATGNDFRAVEAGAHSYAARNGRYESLTKYRINENGDLVGEIELPIAVGIIGGSTRTNPTAQIALKILGAKSSGELAQVIASVGLAQNFAALRALATEGIQRGHMRLHARNIAVTAGATGELVNKVAQQIVAENNIKVHRAKEILEQLKSG